MTNNIKTLLETALHLHSSARKDERKNCSILDEVSNYILHAIHTLEKLDTLDDSHETREIAYLKCSTEYYEAEKRLYLYTNYVHSLHDLTSIHIYELTAHRKTDESYLTINIDNAEHEHKAIIIADFDYQHSIDTNLQNDFKDELIECVFDACFNTSNITFKQLS